MSGAMTEKAAAVSAPKLRRLIFMDGVDTVIPAKAGTQVCMRFVCARSTWVPAFAGMTG